ncbi:MAG: hypothetical protein AAB584_00325 [Patescibacteria group bacterium]
MDTIQNDWLNTHAKKIFSQYGEDGILEKIFEIIKGDKWCVEFGAYDGEHLSNTRNLIVNYGWSAVLIEADPKRFKKLSENYKEKDKVDCLNKFIDFEGENSLDSILKNTNILRDFDLLSIDVDGNDYHLWYSLKTYEPKVVVIEFNPSIPLDIEFIQEKNKDINHGNSLLALYNLAIKKGYRLVATTYLNAFFVKNEFLPLFKIDCDKPYCIHKDMSAQMQIFQLYDGTLVLKEGRNKLLWTSVKIDQEKIQVLPKYLRKFPDKYNRWQVLLLYIYKKKYKFVLRLIWNKIKNFSNFGRLKNQE